MGLFELGDVVEDLGAVAAHGIGMPLGFLVLPLGQGRLGDKRAQAGVVGGLGEVGQLVLGDRQLLAQLAKAGGDLRQAALDEGSGHPEQSTLPPVRPPQAFRLVPLICVVVAAASLAACGSGDGGSAACGPVRRESLDSAYLVHVLDDDRPVQYTSNPPTSGPHKPTPATGGVLDEPISKPIQVGVLERGDVLLQYRPSLDAADRSTLEGFAEDRVTVAPNPDLDDAVVATAWLYKRSCSDVDPDAIEQFVADRVGKGPEG